MTMKHIATQAIRAIRASRRKLGLVLGLVLRLAPKPYGLGLLLITAVAAKPSFAHALPELSTSGLLVEEVLSQSRDPHGFDWRRTPLMIEVLYSSIDEANVFESRSYGITASRSMSPSWIVRAGARRTSTVQTSASQDLALSIYSQAAQPSRYELLLGGGFILLDGRSTTPLSPKISDIGHAVIAIANAQYNLFDADDQALLPGMRAVRYDFVGEAGVRFQTYLPNSLGAAVEWTYSRPMATQDPDLTGWQRIVLSLTWMWQK